MSRTSTVIELCILIALATLLGGGLCFLLFSYLPIIWTAGLIVVILPYFAVCWSLRRTVNPSVYLLIGLGYSALFIWSVIAFTGVKRVERYECNWKVTAEGIEVDLSPAGGFGWSRVAADPLADHLRRDRPAKVQVDVPITRDYGRVRARGGIESVDGIPVREP